MTLPPGAAEQFILRTSCEIEVGSAHPQKIEGVKSFSQVMGEATNFLSLSGPEKPHGRGGMKIENVQT